MRLSLSYFVFKHWSLCLQSVPVYLFPSDCKWISLYEFVPKVSQPKCKFQKSSLLPLRPHWHVGWNFTIAIWEKDYCMCVCVCVYAWERKREISNIPFLISCLPIILLCFILPMSHRLFTSQKFWRMSGLIRSSSMLWKVKNLTILQVLWWINYKPIMM